MRRTWLAALARHRATLRRLDRAAKRLNPLLAMIVIGLALLDISCYAALELGRLRAPLLWPGHQRVALPPSPLVPSPVVLATQLPRQS